MIRLRGIGPTGRTLRARIISPQGLFWNGGGWEAYTAARVAVFGNAVTELGSSGIFDGAVPTALPAGRYDVAYFVRAGGADADTDRFSSSQILQWPGVAGSPATIPLGVLTGAQMAAYIIRGGWVRDDMEAEIYDALTDTILEMEQMFDWAERQTEQTTTDTIATLGDYKIAVEPDMGHLIGVSVIDASFSRPLTRTSKSAFDVFYPDPSATHHRGFPERFSLFGREILVGPAPNSVDYRYRLTYSHRLTTAIDVNTVDVPFSSEYREVLRDGALARLFENVGATGRADRFRQLYALGVDRAKSKERRSRGGPGNIGYSGV